MTLSSYLLTKSTFTWYSDLPNKRTSPFIRKFLKISQKWPFFEIQIRISRKRINVFQKTLLKSFHCIKTFILHPFPHPHIHYFENQPRPPRLFGTPLFIWQVRVPSREERERFHSTSWTMGRARIIFSLQGQRLIRIPFFER